MCPRDGFRCKKFWGGGKAKNFYFAFSRPILAKLQSVQPSCVQQSGYWSVTTVQHKCAACSHQACGQPTGSKVWGWVSGMNRAQNRSIRNSRWSWVGARNLAFFILLAYGAGTGTDLGSSIDTVSGLGITREHNHGGCVTYTFIQ